MAGWSERVQSSSSEECPELVETDPERLGWLYEDVTPLMRAVLDRCSPVPASRCRSRSSSSAGLAPRPLRLVFGGFRAARGKYCLRPFRLRRPARVGSGEWELWLDEEMAAALRRASSAR